MHEVNKRSGLGASVLSVEDGVGQVERRLWGAPGILCGGCGFLGWCWPFCFILLEGSALWTWDKAGCLVHLQGRPQDEKGRGA